MVVSESEWDTSNQSASKSALGRLMHQEPFISHHRYLANRTFQFQCKVSNPQKAGCASRFGSLRTAILASLLKFK
jgi:hypothetical protein